MKPATLEESKVPKKGRFIRVAENLYRLKTSGGNYALIKRGDKQFRRSLKTKGRKQADRRLSELRRKQAPSLPVTNRTLTFEEFAKRWMQITNHTLKASSIARRELGIRMLASYFGDTTVRNITHSHCERWLTERPPYPCRDELEPGA